MDNKTIQSLIFKKRGNPSWKERKLLDRLVEHFEKEIQQNPNALDGMEPAKSFDELKFLHDKYCIEEASILEPEADASVSAEPGKGDNDSKASTLESEVPADEPLDPMNRQAPKVRDYVLEKTSMEPADQSQKGNNNYAPPAGGSPVIPEPTSFEDAFTLPSGNMVGDEEKKGGQNQSDQNGAKQQEKKKERPFNPGFDEMSGDRKRRQVRKFANRITNMVCNLLERGYEWYVTKDITEVQLIQYELNDEMDLNLLVSLDGVQEQTVKAFFQKECLRAKADAAISQDDREDLADALAEVMLEKGIAPTPMQTLIMTGLEIVAKQGIKAMVASSQITALLTQLRQMKQGGVDHSEAAYEEQPVNTPEASMPETPQRPMRPHPSETVSDFADNKPELSEELRSLNA